MSSPRMGWGRRLSRALAHSVSHRLSSSGVKVGSVTAIGRLLGRDGVVVVSLAAWLMGRVHRKVEGGGGIDRSGSVQQPERAGPGHRLDPAVDAELAVQ